MAFCLNMSDQFSETIKATIVSKICANMDILKAGKFF